MQFEPSAPPIAHPPRRLRPGAYARLAAIATAVSFIVSLDSNIQGANALKRLIAMAGILRP